MDHHRCLLHGACLVFFSQPVLLSSMCRNDMPGGRFKQNIDRSINYKFANVECHGPTSDV